MRKPKKFILLIILLAVFVSCAKGNHNNESKRENSEPLTSVSEEAEIEAASSESSPALEEPAPEPEPVPQPSPKASNGVRPEFKRMADEYEAFFNEYCDFMVKYENSSDTLSMLTDYIDFMGKYAKYMESMSNVEEQSMNDAETRYALEANARMQMKLAFLL